MVDVYDPASYYTCDECGEDIFFDTIRTVRKEGKVFCDSDCEDIYNERRPPCRLTDQDVRNILGED